MGRTIAGKIYFEDKTKNWRLPVTGKRYRVYDTEVPGLTVQVTPKGCYSWVLRYTNSRGRQVPATLGRCENMTPSAARKAAKAILQVDDPAAEKKAKRASMTVNELLDLYESEKMIEKGMRESTRIENVRMLKTKVREWEIQPKVEMGTLYADEITGQDAAKCLKACRKTATSTSRQVVGLCKRAWDYGITLGVVKTNPWVGQAKPAVKKKTARLFDEGIRHLGERLKSLDEPLEYKVAFLLFLLTGARHQELCQCRWEWIDWESQWIMVPAMQHKTGGRTYKPRQIFLSSRAIELLKMIPETDIEVEGKTVKHPHLFPAGSRAKDRLGSRDDFQDPWERIREGQSWEWFTEPWGEKTKIDIHDLRRTLGSYCSDLGYKAYVDQLLGHSDKTVTDIYTRTAARPLIDIVQAVNDHIVKLLGWWIGAEGKPVDLEGALISGNAEPSGVFQLEF